MCSQTLGIRSPILERQYNRQRKITNSLFGLSVKALMRKAILNAGWDGPSREVATEYATIFASEPSELAVISCETLFGANSFVRIVSQSLQLMIPLILYRINLNNQLLILTASRFSFSIKVVPQSQVSSVLDLFLRSPEQAPASYLKGKLY
ncbi:hypothetical protein RF11_00367 [Thelohanellus kitauei]|uniref:Uncharacterized protein n=1 Tax=Thelohanellus kitauei TaxID=669202 RepID=A0A0C2MUS0_THEKT|nr:hypothetical protein RF11_00367 [Thelohanellus kitauei]